LKIELAHWGLAPHRGRCEGRGAGGLASEEYCAATACAKRRDSENATRIKLT
jgi:hypothetical protein